MKFVIATISMAVLVVLAFAATEALDAPALQFLADCTEVFKRDAA